ncbi:MAG: hypothetical protein M0Z57_07065 [Deltaproteobacteria bacterium]|jgi:hypothetical protein|nr:hypothetical protein [Deltaproteobacteria bacterium]
MKFLFLALISAVFTITVSGCGYNSSYTPLKNERLTPSQKDKLNGIMFAYLNIPVAKFSTIAPQKTRRKAGSNYYQPSDVVKIINPSPGPVPVKTVKAENGAGYNIKTRDDMLFLKILARQAVKINKMFNIGKTDIVVKGIRYDRGYEVVSLLVKNLGNKKIVKENFKYSNAGRTFGIKKYEILQNLTVADKYKKGMTLCVKILNF